MNLLRRFRRPLICLGCHLGLSILAFGLEDWLLGYGLQPFWAGLFLPFPVMYLSLGDGLLCAVCTGAWLGVYSPGYFVALVNGFMAAHLLGYFLRGYGRRERSLHLVLLGMVLGSLLFWALQVYFCWSPSGVILQEAWPRLWADWALSMGLVSFFGPGYFRFQYFMFKKLGIYLNAELQSP